MRREQPPQSTTPLQALTQIAGKRDIVNGSRDVGLLQGTSCPQTPTRARAAIMLLLNCRQTCEVTLNFWLSSALHACEDVVHPLTRLQAHVAHPPIFCGPL